MSRLIRETRSVIAHGCIKCANNKPHLFIWHKEYGIGQADCCSCGTPNFFTSISAKKRISRKRAGKL